MYILHIEINFFYYDIQVVQSSLGEVKLTNAAKMRASSYSGGMKRRLSVAIALIGDPRVIILDEPVSMQFIKSCYLYIRMKHVL